MMTKQIIRELEEYLESNNIRIWVSVGGDLMISINDTTYYLIDYETYHNDEGEFQLHELPTTFDYEVVRDG